MAGNDPARVSRFRLTAPVAEGRIRKAAKQSERVILGQHARQRMRERGIDDADVFRLLREGVVVEAPEPAEPGEWKCKIVRRIRGSRDVGVITIILQSGRLFVKTVEWEDQK
jgi:Domain of unknown function (DUF4258)